MNYRNNGDKDSAVLMSVYYKDKPFQLYCCLWSLVNQTYKNHIVLICLDGRVTKAISNVIKYFTSHYDNIIVIEKTENSGLAHSLNALIDKCQNEYPNILFYFRMDADDICTLDRIQKQKNFLTLNPHIQVLGGSCKEFGLYSKIITKPENDDEIKSKIIRITPFIHPTVVFRSELFYSGIRYPIKTHLTEDLALWLELSRIGINFHNIRDVVLFYRLNNKTLHRRMSIRKAASEFLIRMSFIKETRRDVTINILYCIGHFSIRIMPVTLSKILYRILR